MTDEPIIKDEKLREAIRVLSSHCQNTACENCVFFDGEYDAYGEIRGDCTFHKEFPNEMTYMLK